MDGAHADEGPETISLVALADRFVEAHQTMKNRAFAFVLGAGASRTSGIKSGGEMVADWIRLLHREAVHNAVGDGKDWATAMTLKISKHDPDDPAASYSELYRRMYRNDPDRGYAYLEEQMRSAEPSYGYSVLARIMEDHQHKVVVTTNFDNLVADSLSIFSKTYPLVCGHESLAGFISARARRPVVVKVHRDLLLAPKSTPEDLTDLPIEFVKALAELFRHYTPIVIGYGGNDGSLMKFFKGLPPKSIPGGVYWCYWEGGPSPSAEIREFVVAQCGSFVPIPGFDETMMLLGNRLELPVPDQFLIERAKARADRIVEQAAKLRERLAPTPPEAKAVLPVARVDFAAVPNFTAMATQPPPTTKEPASADAAVSSELATAILTTLQRADGERRWWQWDNLAQSEPRPTERDRIYRQALDALPASTPLLGNYAVFLSEVKKDPDTAEAMYKRALETDPKHAHTLGNYAVFLAYVRKDLDAAEAMYKRALEADPRHANNLGNYAVFLANLRKDPGAAEAMYKRALEADPKHANNLGNYAVFLKNVKKDPDTAEAMYKRALEVNPKHAGLLNSYASFLGNVQKNPDAAEAMYKRALEADPKHAHALGSYAVFLGEVRKDPDAAEAMFKRALEMDPKHANTLGNYAVFLKNVRKDSDAAEAMYERALEADPKHAYTLCNYAVLLAYVRKDPDAAEVMFKRALETEPKDANILTNWAVFLGNVRKDPDAAEAIFKRALETEPKDANTFGNYAVFLKNVRKDPDAAEMMYKRALEVDPNRANILGSYALLWGEVRKDPDAAEVMFKHALESDPKDANILGNYARFLFGAERIEEGLRTLDRALKANDTGESNPLEVELLMYATCQWIPTRWREALGHLKVSLVEKKLTTGDWDFSGVIETAKKRGHPEASWLDALAKVCAGTATPSILESWDAWKNAR